MNVPTSPRKKRKYRKSSKANEGIYFRNICFPLIFSKFTMICEELKYKFYFEASASKFNRLTMVTSITAIKP